MGISDDLTIGCSKQDRASLARLFVIAKCDITNFTAGSLQDFTAVTLTTTAKVWFRYDGEFKTKSLAMEGTNDNGTATFITTLEFKVRGMDKTVGKRAQDLVDEGKAVFIVETANSSGTDKIAFVVGWDNIIFGDAAGIPNVSGVVEGELAGDNSFTIQSVSEHAEVLREFVGTIDTNTDGVVSFGT